MYDNPALKKKEGRALVKNLTPLFLLVAIGFLIFFTVTFTFSFKEKVFQTFFPKPLSYAEENFLPKVELLAKVNNTFKTKVINVPAGASEIILNWKTENDPTSCSGNFWSNVQSSSVWATPRNVKGGEFTIEDNLTPGIYVYSINCANEYGDAAGSSITINVGAKQNSLQPHIVSFQVLESDNPLDLSQQNKLSKNTNLQIQWSSLNTDTPYGVCVATGSWPTVYKDMGALQIQEIFSLTKAKVYQYQVICTNEYGYDQRLVSFVVK